LSDKELVVLWDRLSFIWPLVDLPALQDYALCSRSTVWLERMEGARHFIIGSLIYSTDSNLYSASSSECDKAIYAKTVPALRRLAADNPQNMNFCSFDGRTPLKCVETRFIQCEHVLVCFA
jgi:hypothetical protein